MQRDPKGRFVKGEKIRVLFKHNGYNWQIGIFATENYKNEGEGFLWEEKVGRNNSYCEKVNYTNRTVSYWLFDTGEIQHPFNIFKPECVKMQYGDMEIPIPITNLGFEWDFEYDDLRSEKGKKEVSKIIRKRINHVKNRIKNISQEIILEI